MQLLETPSKLSQKTPSTYTTCYIRNYIFSSALYPPKTSSTKEYSLKALSHPQVALLDDIDISWLVAPFPTNHSCNLDSFASFGYLLRARLFLLGAPSSLPPTSLPVPATSSFPFSISHCSPSLSSATP